MLATRTFSTRYHRYPRRLRRPAVGFVAVTSMASLWLAACSDSAPTASQHAATTTQSTITSTTSTTATNSTTSTASTAPTTSSTQQSLDGAVVDSLREIVTRVPVEPGDHVDVAGQPATVCTYGDGFGLHVVVANQFASCEFAHAVTDVFTAGLNATDNDVRAVLPATKTVNSQVTGREYEVTCTADADRVVRCVGGEGAEIWMY